MEKKIKVSIIGIGGRGTTYIDRMVKEHGGYELVSICDINPERIALAKTLFGIPDVQVFLNEDDFFKEKRGDLCVVSTQDQDHVRHAIKALELGYDVLCEKPISNQENEVRELLKAQKKYGKKVFICHVLRYAPAFKKVKELIDEGVIGDIVTIDAVENVYYEHYCHSFVRGLWRNSNETSPMILAKCCHDLDLLTWYAGSECDFVSSMGDNRFFNHEHKPAGASDRCKDCKYRGKCQFDAYHSYIDRNFWGKWYLTNERPIKDENVIKALDNGQYGRCVFACDNNVVDNQIVNIRFKNGITANLKMLGFTATSGRIMKFYGTHGQIDLDEVAGKITIMVFGEKEQVIEISTLTDTFSGHGGGDKSLAKHLYNALVNNDMSGMSSLSVSVESHLMGFAAEESRLNNGKLIQIKH